MFNWLITIFAGSYPVTWHFYNYGNYESMLAVKVLAFWMILTWVGITYLLLRWLNILGLRPEVANWLRVQGQIRLLVRQWKLTSCSRGKPCLFTVTSHTAGKCLRRDKDDDTHSGRGRGLYANVDQSPLSGRGHVTPLDKSGRLSLNCHNHTTVRSSYASFVRRLDTTTDSPRTLTAYWS